MAEEDGGKHMLADVFDELFSEDFDSLNNAENILQKFQKKEKSLSNAIKESETQTEGNLANLIETCSSMLEELNTLNEDVTKLLTTQTIHENEISEAKESLLSLVTEGERLEQEVMYNRWVEKIKSLSSEVNGFIEKGNVKHGVESHFKLYQICASLQSTACVNLQKYSYTKCEELYEKLKSAFVSNLNEILSSMKYPFPNGVSAPIFNQKEETEEQFKNLLTIAVNLESLSIDSKYSLVTILLTEPLKKRFHFHFYGDRHTNNVEKPEWFFTQILGWIRDHTSFIEGYIEPLLQEFTKDEDFTLKDEFFEILLTLCQEKLQSTLEKSIDDDMLLAHLIDETMLFDKELQGLIVGTQFNCVNILLKQPFLKHWIDLEKKLALEVLTNNLQKDDAWLPKFSELNVIDKALPFYVPRCVEEFVTLLTMMMGRYENISEKNSQRLFLDVLLSTLYSFIVEIKNKASLEHIKPESQCFCSIMNGVFYISHVLYEWSNDIRFLSLFIGEEDEELKLDEEEKKDGSEKKVEGPFQHAISTLDKFLDELIEWLVEYLQKCLKNKLKSYKAESWHSLPKITEYVTPLLSPGACGIMLFIKEHLHLLQEKCYDDVFEKIWRQFSYSVDQLIFSEIICDCHFNEGGASQIQFDIKKNLYVLFAQFTPRVESYFKRLKESCILLNLLPGSALLIKEQLKSKKKGDDESIQLMLEEHGVRYLSVDQVMTIMNSRIDWPRVS